MVLILNSRGNVISDASQPGLTLDLVQVIFRHGERTPLEQEASMFNIDEPSMFESDFGMLTKKGMMQEYKLGQLLYDHYHKHLGKYKASNVEAVTTNSARTQLSLELVLAGLFPPAEDEKWHLDLNWKPVPFDVIPPSDNVFLSPHWNPKFLTFWKSTIMKSKDYQNEVAKHAKLFNDLEKFLDKSLMDDVPIKVGFTCSMLKISKSLNISIPRWFTKEKLAILDNFFIFLINSMSCTKKLKKLNGGQMIKRIIENIERNKADAAKKMYLYSTHDLTLHGFTAVQDIVNAFEVPPFGSCYIVESYKDKKQCDFVRILSWDGSSDNFVELKVNNCQNYIPLEKYKNTVEDIFPTDEELKFFQSENKSKSIYDFNSLKVFNEFNFHAIPYLRILFTLFVVTVITMYVVISNKHQYYFT